MAKRSLSLKAVPIVIALAALAAIAAWLMLREPPTAPVAVEDATRAPAGVYPITRTVEINFMLKNLTGRVRENARLLVYAPVKHTGTQWVTRLDVSHPHKVLGDSLGNQLLVFEFHDLPGNATFDVSVKTTLAQADTPDPHLEADPDLMQYTRPDAFIESESPEVVALAKTLKARNARASAGNILEWVADNIKAPAPAPADAQAPPADPVAALAERALEDQGARYALKQKQAGAWDRVYLITALLRACDVPARPVAGFLYADNATLGPRDLRAWVTFLDGDVWRVADPQTKSVIKKPSRYIAFRAIDRTPAIVVRELGNLLYEPVGVNAEFKG